MQADLGWSLLSARRVQARLTLTFKLCHLLCDELGYDVVALTATHDTPASRRFVAGEPVSRKILRTVE